MIVCIFGSREFDGPEGELYVRIAMKEAMELFNFSLKDITEIVSGRCPTGIDKWGERRAEANGIPIIPFPAQWDDLNAPGAKIKRRRDGTKYNANAGFTRNRLMAHYVHDRKGLGVGVWDGVSGGTRNMRDHLKHLGVPFHIYIPPPF